MKNAMIDYRTLLAIVDTEGEASEMSAENNMMEVEREVLEVVLH